MKKNKQLQVWLDEIGIKNIHMTLQDVKLNVIMK